MWLKSVYIYGNNHKINTGVQLFGTPCMVALCYTEGDYRYSKFG